MVSFEQVQAISLINVYLQLHFSVKEIRKIICSLDLNKDPDHDN